MNEVIVARAPRIQKVLYETLESGTYYLGLHANWNLGYMIYEKDCPNRGLSKAFHLPYMVALPPNHVVPLGDFDAMCKWVSNGRRLEDLQSDCKDEWIHVSNMKVGTVAEVMTRNFDDDDLIGKVVVRFDGSTVQALDDPQCRWANVDKITAPFSVWPLGPGDSITIKPKNP